LFFFFFVPPPIPFKNFCWGKITGWVGGGVGCPITCCLMGFFGGGVGWCAPAPPVFFPHPSFPEKPFEKGVPPRGPKNLNTFFVGGFPPPLFLFLGSTRVGPRKRGGKRIKPPNGVGGPPPFWGSTKVPPTHPPSKTVFFGGQTNAPTKTGSHVEPFVCFNNFLAPPPPPLKKQSREGEKIFGGWGVNKPFLVGGGFFFFFSPNSPSPPGVGVQMK